MVRFRLSIALENLIYYLYDYHRLIPLNFEDISWLCGKWQMPASTLQIIGLESWADLELSIRVCVRYSAIITLSYCQTILNKLDIYIICFVIRSESNDLLTFQNATHLIRSGDTKGVRESWGANFSCRSRIRFSIILSYVKCQLEKNIK